MLIIVLNDGETFSGIAGCSVYSVPEAATTEEIEAALDEGALKPTLTFSNESAERLVEREGT